MNRPLIITIGIILILIVLGVWIYLLFFGTPDSPDEVFSNLGFELQTQPTTIAAPVAIPEQVTTIDTTTEALQQLTTRAVAGFTFVSSSSTQHVRYAERGTGHIYNINLATGVEEALSRTTIPQTAQAFFSPDGESVALVTHTNYTSNVFVGSLGDAVNLEGIQLPTDAKNVRFLNNTDILYTLAQNGVTNGFRQNLQTLSSSQLFSFPFMNIDMTWGSNLERMYLATKPDRNHEGFIYTIENGDLKPATPSAYGLSALHNNNTMVITFIEDGTYISTIHPTDTEQTYLPIIAPREKCVFDARIPNQLWCAAPVTIPSTTFVDDWYKGTVTSEDDLWRVDIDSGVAELYVSFKETTGRVIDVATIATSQTSTALAFINKTDQTLWLYDTTTE